MGQEHRPERRMGNFTSTAQQFGQAYFEPKAFQDWRDLPPENPHSFEYARPKKPTPTRPSSETRTK